MTKYHVGGFFVASELEGFDESLPLYECLEAAGYDVKADFLSDALWDAGLDDSYDANPEFTIALIDIPTSTLGGHRLMALYDSEDGPVALYLKPVKGLAVMQWGDDDA